MISITKICPAILDHENQEALEQEGLELTIDTTNILSTIELEQLSSDELQEVKSSLGVFNAHIQLKRFIIN